MQIKQRLGTQTLREGGGGGCGKSKWGGKTVRELGNRGGQRGKGRLKKERVEDRGSPGGGL